MSNACRVLSERDAQWSAIHARAKDDLMQAVDALTRAQATHNITGHIRAALDTLWPQCVE